ncbi:MAG: cell division protein FtsZ [Spirochaetaceae bacterium]|jgi:cell division protein FtsZ|nr:cell division protein FtsZ [Spirochaetaceae bacterium]
MNVEVIPEAVMTPCPTVVKVIGAGGGGSNAVNRMIEFGIDNVQFIAVNTDVQALSRCNAAKKVPIGGKLTKGLGAGGKPTVGENAAIEDREKLENVLRGADMIFVTAGMGGGTGTGSAPVIAQTARELDALTVAVVTKPFDFEGKHKMKLAEEGIEKLREQVDALIVIPNTNLLQDEDKDTPMSVSFRKADDVLRAGVQGISDLITHVGDMNIDFADVREAMKDKGDALLGIGCGSGVNKGLDAAKEAVHNPLYETNSIDGATHILVNITCNSKFSGVEYREVMDFITENADPDAVIKIGLVFDDAMEDAVKVTVVATGFQNVAKAAELNAKKVEEEKRPGSNELFDLDGLLKTGKQKTNLPDIESDLDTPTIMRQNRFTLLDTRRQAGGGA